MLSQLEYYQGILFLTTNLVSVVDPAFFSRIDVHLVYLALSKSTRLALWKRMLEFANISDRVSDEDLTDLASYELNGREIKNVIKMGSKWCSIKKEALTAERLRTSIILSAPMSKRCNLDDDTQPGTKRPRLS
jgi:hypothetical protein